MKNPILIICILLLFPILGKAQMVEYRYAETVSEIQGDVTFRLFVFCDSKKMLDSTACLAGIRCVMFSGIPGTKFSKPLLNDGEKTLMSEFPGYFKDLYGTRYTDYVKDCVMLSKFKKSGKGKSTLFEITVKAFDLRKDLEKNHIKTTFGI